jgi:hypothetical protein
VGEKNGLLRKLKRKERMKEKPRNFNPYCPSLAQHNHCGHRD